MFVHSATKNATIPHHRFHGAIGVWVMTASKSVSWCSIFQCTAAEFTDIATVEELSLFLIGWKMDHLLNISWEFSL